MLIAVAVSAGDLYSVIPETFEESTHLLIIETEKDKAIATYVPRDAEGLFFARQTVLHDCEAIVCGRMQQPGFEYVASNSITRYYGTGLPALEAAHAAEENLLPFITEYEGGPGCGGDSGDARNCEAHMHGEED